MGLLAASSAERALDREAPLRDRAGHSPRPRPVTRPPPATDLLPWLRRTSLVEQVTYLLLLGIAMPLKYWYAEPMMVRVVGTVHGVLFLLLVWLLVKAHIDRGWPVRRLLLVFVASLLPIWPFLLDRRMRAWIAATPPAS